MSLGPLLRQRSRLVGWRVCVALDWNSECNAVKTEETWIMYQWLAYFFRTYGLLFFLRRSLHIQHVPFQSLGSRVYLNWIGTGATNAFFFDGKTCMVLTCCGGTSILFTFGYNLGKRSSPVFYSCWSSEEQEENPAYVHTRRTSVCTWNVTLRWLSEQFANSMRHYRQTDRLMKRFTVLVSCSVSKV